MTIELHNHLLMILRQARKWLLPVCVIYCPGNLRISKINWQVLALHMMSITTLTFVPIGLARQQASPWIARGQCCFGGGKFCRLSS